VTLIATTDARSVDSPEGESTGIDWLLRVDRGTLQLAITSGRLITHGALTAFVTGDVTSAATPESNGVSLLPARAVVESLVNDIDRGLPALRGQFIVAASDARTRVVRVLRDPLGTHPLFYTERPDAVLFAARPRVLLRQPGVSKDLNRAAIADHLCKRWPDDHETFFAAVRRVPPGCEVVLSAAGVRTRRCWSPTPDPDQIDWLSDDGVERFDALLDQAVGRGLNRGPAAIFLSGGIDSVSVAAVAKDLAVRSNRPIPLGLSLGFPDPACDERDLQRSVADRLGIPLKLIDFDTALGGQGLLRRAAELSARLDAPLFNTWLPTYLALIDQGRAAGVDTILTGEGGDEWLGTSPFLAADLWRRGDIAGLLRLSRTWTRSYTLSWPRVLRLVGWRYGLRPLAGMMCHGVAPQAWDRSRARRVVKSVPAWVSPDPGLRALQYDRALRQLAPANPVGGFYSRESKVVLSHPLTSWLFEEQFAVGRPLGIRYVHPYWDADVVAHVYRIRPDLLNARNRTKALVRQALERRFPTLGFERQRKVLALDFFTGLVRSQGPGVAAGVADFKGLASLDIVVPAATRTYLDQAWRGDAWHVGSAWNILNTEVWIRSQLQ
jgi:asparagine synthetase B (glutamine-hydrolysing)